MSSSTHEQRIRSTIEALYRSFAQQDVALLRKVVTPDWEYIPEPPGAAPGPDQMVQIFNNIAAALPDIKIEILDLLIHGDRVGVRAEVSGTQSGELLGIAPSAKHIRFAVHSFHQMRGELIAKTWHLEDWLSVFRQLGQSPTSFDPH